MMTVSTVSWVSLGVGLIFGFLAQRSRMCFVGGWRDFFLVRDTYLLKGFIAFFVTAALFFFGFWLANYRDAMSSYPWFVRENATFSSDDYFNELLPILEAMGVADNWWENPDIFTDLIPENMFGHSYSFCWLQTGKITLVEGRDVRAPGVDIFGLHIPNELIIILVGALLLGFCSVMANGCPLRQHVMASSGNASAMTY
ncbi:MAG: YeeE/YedE family protein, partial [Clostridiales bacterium]|nr:YeeE/YedE family protein [Clostridiales bacterium]